MKPLTEINWNEKDRWQYRIKKRIDKLHHKLDAIKYHMHLFKNFERNTEESYKRYLVANTTMNKIHDDPHLIYNLESFLFQSKSCLDVFAQIIAYSFKFETSSYNGNDLIKILQKEPSKNYPEYASKIIGIIQKNHSWVKQLVETRDEVTHYSDLEGFSCFLIVKSEKKNKVVRIYYPAMPSGQRASKYMDKTWANIQVLINDCAYLLMQATKTTNKNN